MSLTKSWELSVSKLIAKTWLSNDFHQRFINNPLAILQEAGLMLEEFVDAKVMQNLASGKDFQYFI